jgi:drug/metabolite transporter (DMT)-like permease
VQKFSQKPWFDTFLAWYFVLVWGSGFLATKVALQYTTPLVFLSIRYGLGILCLAPVAVLLKLRWPQTPIAWLHVIVAGLLVHAMNLGGSHYAQFLGMSAGTTAMILAAQPLLTAMIAALWMNERLVRVQWAGIVVGLIGVGLVVWHKIDVHAVSAASLVAIAISLVGTTGGTLYQRVFCRDADLRSASLIQFVASFAVLFPLAWGIDDLRVRWTWQLLAAAIFLVIGASIFALNAFHTLMRRGQATRVASLMYLTPVIAVILEFLMFGIAPSALSIAGMLVVCVGVALVARRSLTRRG